MNLRISSAAREDLLSLWEYIAAHDELAADRYLDHVRERAMELIAHPELGRPRPEVLPGIRSLLCRNHLIFYRIEKEIIQILRVLHVSMDLPNQDHSGDE